ncbi:hypothetical protein [Methylobacterium nigriterrae]|uniref:hypothetical protein n=1 Tax=Methylobacterium nigriterrae TaxID=3127512 RepID=UPI003013C347
MSERQAGTQEFLGDRIAAKAAHVAPPSEKLAEHLAKAIIEGGHAWNPDCEGVSLSSNGAAARRKKAAPEETA